MGDEKRFFFLYEYGLIRSPYRAEGIREMERLLVDPDVAVTELFLGGLAAASIDPGSGLVTQYMEKRSTLRKKLSEALPAKRGTARTISTNTVQRFR